MIQEVRLKLLFDSYFVSYHRNKCLSKFRCFQCSICGVMLRQVLLLLLPFILTLKAIEMPRIVDPLILACQTQTIVRAAH